MSIKFKVNGQWTKAKVYAIVDAIHTAFSSDKLSSTNVSDALEELADGKEMSLEARLARAEALGHHAENVPIDVNDDSVIIAYAFNIDYQLDNPDVYPPGARLLKCVISDGENSSVLDEIPFCFGKNFIAQSEECVKAVGVSVRDSLGFFDINTWLGQSITYGLELTAEIWWEE